MTDSEFINEVLKGGVDMDRAMKTWYNNESIKNTIYPFLYKLGCADNEAEDILQDGLISMILNIRNQKFQSNSTLKTYLISICKNIYLGRKKRSQILKKIQKRGNLNWSQSYQLTPEEIINNKEKHKYYESVLDKLGDKCQQVLRMWSMGYSMIEIAQSMKYTSAGMAKKKKFLCLKKLKEIILTNKNKPLSHE